MSFTHCTSCDKPVGCRIAQTCIQAAGLRAVAIPAPEPAPKPPHNPTMQRAVAAAVAVQQSLPVRKLTADVCFVGGCRKQAETGTGCIGVCQELKREEYEAAAQAAEARQPLEAPGPAAEATVAPTPGLEAPGRIVLCIDCKSYDKKMTQPKLLGDCINKALPLNLITGERRFPCMIARGYSQLCGTEARLWEKR